MFSQQTAEPDFPTLNLELPHPAQNFQLVFLCFFFNLPIHYYEHTAKFYI